MEVISASKPFLLNASTYQNIGSPTFNSTSSQQNDAKCGGKRDPSVCPPQLPTYPREANQTGGDARQLGKDPPPHDSVPFNSVCLDLLPQ